MPAIFVSHSSLDPKEASDIKDALARLGFERVFLDFDKVTGIGVGENWEKRLYEELSRCHAVILVLTPGWLDSKWCFAELTTARALGKIIIPVVCKPMSERLVLPDLQAVDLLDWSKGGLERLQQRLLAIENELARGFALDPNRPPYPGIHAFEAEDAAIYFGRDEETRAVIERLDARRTQGGARFLLIIGASGAGKSSLLKAGILPQLARRRTHWLPLPAIRPEKAPLEALAKAIAHYLNEPAQWDGWYGRLRGAQAVDEFVKLTRGARIGDARAATVLLPIDQFEEVFTIAEASDRTAFVNLLAAVLDPARDLPVIVIATGRADVLHGLLERSALASLTETISLLPMPLDRVPRLVEGPAAVVGLVVEKGLAERIMRDVESPNALPLLAYMLHLLYVRSADDKRLTLDAYLALGDPHGRLNPVQNSVRLAADQAIGGLAPSEEELAALRDAFVPNLVRLRLDDGRRVRQPAPVSALPQKAQRLVRALTQARLLTARAENGEAIIEVTHEALFEAWPTLAGWLRQEQAFLADIELLKSAYQVWKDAADADQRMALLRGLLLSRARHWMTEYPQRFAGPELLPLRGFIAASAREERRRARRVVALVGIPAFLVVLGLVGWLNERYLQERWRWFTIIRPYVLTQVRPYVLTPEAERALKLKDSFRECAKYCPEMVVVPNGEFLMGSLASEKHYANEEPQHKVVIAKPFAVSKFDVTFDEWDACVAYGDCDPGITDSGWGRGRQPVIQVTWGDAQRYVAWLSEMTGKSYRLLSEAEWEYAARAGMQTAYSWGDEVGIGKANCGGCPSRWEGRAAPVGSFAPNQFGLYDMHGNVGQWVEDCYHEDYRGAPQDGSAWNEGTDCNRRISRGGSWYDPPEVMRSAARFVEFHGNRHYVLGFRVGRTLTP